MRNFKITSIVILAIMAFSACEEGLDFLSDDPREAFVGDWSVSENTSRKSTLIFYEVSIVKSTSDTTLVHIYNFYEIGNNKSVEAVVTGSNISISSQTRAEFTFQGSGNMAFNDKTISLSYTVDYNDGNPAENVTATYTRQ